MNKQNKQSIGEYTVYYNKVNLLHKSSKTHPENPQRLNILIQSLHQLNKILTKFCLIEVTVDDIAISQKQTQNMLIQMHGQAYWEFVKQMWHDGIKKPQMYINTDTYFMKNTYIAALEAARTTLIAANNLTKQKIKGSFALVRPPGHHSGLKTQPHGFSFFNNVGIAANHLINEKFAKKIAIIDWDVHHGEGTQKLFYSRKDVLYISLHRFDNGKFFPHINQSSSKNIGTGEGQGYNINVCWNLQQKPKGYTYQRNQTCGDEQYSYAFNKIVMPVLKQYNPDFILVSCGFDSACGDPIGNLQITQIGYTLMTKKLKQLNKKILLVLQGGYSKQVLGWAGCTIIKALINEFDEKLNEKLLQVENNEPNKVGRQGVEQCINCIQKYWLKN